MEKRGLGDSLSPVNALNRPFLRAFVLLLLIALLPLRGAFGAALACAGLGTPAAATVSTGPAMHAGHAHHGGDAAAAHTHGTHAQEPATQDSTGSSDTCTLCAACCAMQGPVTATTVPPLRPAAMAFPTPGDPPPEFVAGALERPPRNL